MSDVVRAKSLGLLDPLPAGERVLWSGKPAAWSLAWRTFHVRETLAWFALIGVARVVSAWSGGERLGDAVIAQSGLAVLCCIAVGLLAGVAAMSARTTVYVLTERRMAMRIGMALPLTVNIPLAKISDAALRLSSDGTGDIGLAFGDGTRLAWFVLWPHCRPWRLRHPEPMLRAVPDAAGVADLLSNALAADSVPGAFVRTNVETATALPAHDVALPASGMGATS